MSDPKDRETEAIPIEFNSDEPTEVGLPPKRPRSNPPSSFEADVESVRAALLEHGKHIAALEERISFLVIEILHIKQILQQKYEEESGEII